MNTGEVVPFRGERGGRVARKDKLEESPESQISGVSNTDCGIDVQSAHIPCHAAAETQAKEVKKD